jgi:hypothetical protein
LSIFVLSVTGAIFVVVFSLLAYSVVKFRGKALDRGTVAGREVRLSTVLLYGSRRTSSSAR